MIRFQDLPSEIFDEILGVLSTNEHYSLILACRTLQERATPHLFHEICLIATRSKSCAQNLALLLRTLLERPHLVSYVTTLRLRGALSYWERYDPWPENSERLTSVKLWGLDKGTRKESLITPELFHRFVEDKMEISESHLHGRSKDGLTALIITQLTNLETLELGDGFLRYSIFLPQILRRTEYLFPNLQRVILGDKQPSRGGAISYIDLDLIRPVFYSSTVKEFEWTMGEPWKFHWNEAKPPCNTHLTSLCLFRTNVTRLTLFQLLSATPALKHLRYEQEIVFNDSLTDTTSLAPYLELEGLNKALACLQATLETCQLLLRLAPGSISISQYESSGLRFPLIEGTLSALKHMPRLKSIEVPIALLFGWLPRSYARLEELLPENLIDLTLRDDFLPFCSWSRPSSRERRIARIGRYIKSRRSHAPCLRSVKVRLTSAKKCLRDAVQKLNLSIDEHDAKTEILRGMKSETYCWYFETAQALTNRPDLGQRIDSMLRPE